MRADWVALADIQRLPRNSKLHDLKDIEESFGEFGFVDRVIINETTGNLVSGHGRSDACTEMKKRGEPAPEGVDVRFDDWYLPCDYIQCEAGKEDALALRLNVSQMKGGDYDIEEILKSFDAGMLYGVLEDDITRAASGLGDDAYEALRKQLEPEEIRDVEPQIERAEELRVKWGVQLGDLWELGDHRLICGDCTDIRVIKELMGDEKASLCFTSPPYWVGKKYETQKTIEEINLFIRDVARAIVQVTRKDKSRIVINTGTGFTTSFNHKEKRHVLLLIDKWTNAFYELGWNLRHIRHWLKEGQLPAISSKTDLIDQHCEYIASYQSDSGEEIRFEDYLIDDEVHAVLAFYNRLGDQRGREKTRSGKSWAMRSYWNDIRGNANSNEHDAAFPVMLVFRHLLLYTRKDEIVFEPLSGSGSTIIGCENLSRKCRAIEISPAYVAVTLERWSELTMKTPVKIVQLEVAI